MDVEFFFLKVGLSNTEIVINIITYYIIVPL
jgi:hypothetical protein